MNDYILNMHLLNPKTVVIKACCLLHQWKLTNELKASPYPSITFTQTWVPPPPPLCKLKFDGSYSPQQQTGGIEGIIRSDKGQLVAAYSDSTVASTSAIEAELMALYQGLQLCQKVAIDQIIIEGDALDIIKSLQGFHNISWQFMFVWNRILSVLKTNFCWRISFYKRTGNQIADLLSNLNPPSMILFRQSFTLSYSIYLFAGSSRPYKQSEYLRRHLQCGFRALFYRAMFC